MSQLANLSVLASLEKSKLASDGAWLTLLDITWPDGTVTSLVRNNEDILFDYEDSNGPRTYTAFSWEFDPLSQSADGSIPSWKVRCSNVGRAIEALLEKYSGGVGGQISVYVVNSKRLKREPDIELNFGIIESNSDAAQCEFTLGAPSPFRLMYPRHTFTPNQCIWSYKSAECGYAGSLPSCSFSIDGSNGCRAHSNQMRFGAFPGIDSNGTRAISVK